MIIKGVEVNRIVLQEPEDTLDQGVFKTMTSFFYWHVIHI